MAGSWGGKTPPGLPPGDVGQRKCQERAGGLPCIQGIWKDEDRGEVRIRAREGEGRTVEQQL